MDKYWLQVTSGRGPAECEFLVEKIWYLIEEDALKESVRVELEFTEPGSGEGLLKSILLLVSHQRGLNFSSRWVGSIKWSCQSPFRPNHRRKNWFASVNKIESKEFKYSLNESEIRVERMSATGPGGQNVNKLEVGVRLTHLPSGVTAVGSDQRSLEQNMKIAMKRLKAKLDLGMALAKQEKNKQNWQNHDALERGNPVKVFVGPKFEERLK